jgi:nicotinate-nucleotide pyrophosphorylase (carboxylating)
MTDDFPVAAARRIVAAALREDLGEKGDATTAALVPRSLRARGAIVFRERAVAAGLPVAELVFCRLARSMVVQYRVSDGEEVEPGTEAVVLIGSAAAMLTGERTALNFIQRLSGIATRTRAFVRASRVPVYDTRKTTAGLRALEKYAVRAGGGRNHRQTLEVFFGKDNHIALCGLDRVLEAAPEGAIVEAATPEDAERVAACPRVARILLDNMPPAALREAVRRIRSVRADVTIEASGGITLQNVREISETGVDCISVGAITHSAPAVDVSLTISPIK